MTPMGRMLGAVGPSERRYWPLTRSADGPSLSRCAGGTWLPAQTGEASGTQRAAMDLANEFFFFFSNPKQEKGSESVHIKMERGPEKAILITAIHLFIH